jgi:hypothetical protein
MRELEYCFLFLNNFTLSFSVLVLEFCGVSCSAIASPFSLLALADRCLRRGNVGDVP